MNTNKIDFNYNFDTTKIISSLTESSNVDIISETPRIKVENTYYKAGYRGTTKQVYTRKAIAMRLERALEMLPSHLGFVIFDAFRSIETQKNIFMSFFSSIKNKNPNMSEKELHIEVRKFVAHPDEPSRFEIPPHNSGGAIDLAIYDIEKDEILNFGTEFDDLTEKSKTAYFEQKYILSGGINIDAWEEIKSNRRMLYEIMVKNGFINFKSEWWHYSIGDCLWASELNLNWFYPSLEDEAKRLMGS